MVGGGKLIKFVVFVIVVLMMLGIGSEVLVGFVIIFDDGCKFIFVSLFFILKVVICDFELIFGLLKGMIVVIGMDVIIYCIEVFFVFIVNLFVDGVVLDGLWCGW